MPVGSFVHMHVIIGADTYEQLIERTVREQVPVSTFVEDAVWEKLQKQQPENVRQQGRYPGQPKSEYKSKGK